MDIASGRLGRAGKSKRKYGSVLAERHPQTGFVFEGAILPFWDELKELVGRAARALVPLRALGWDIAICPDGPRVVEANQHYDIFLMQELSGGLRGNAYWAANGSRVRLAYS